MAKHIPVSDDTHAKVKELRDKEKRNFDVLVADMYEAYIERKNADKEKST